MSQLVDAKRAYDQLAKLLDQEIRKRTGLTKDLQRVREELDVAFYLLGWARFEYLVRQEANDLIDEKARAHTIEKHAWRYLKQNLKRLSVRKQLDLVFHSNQPVRSTLDKEYDFRNDAAHAYKKLPNEARDISNWLGLREDLVDKF